MQWLNELPFADNRVLQIGLLAACGIAALIVLAIVYRLTFAHRLRVPGGRTRQPRLGLVDAFSLDGQRQLVLIRRDNIEHLVMIGGPNDVLVESQINRAVVTARESNQASPLLVATAPARRTEAAALPASSAIAEPSAKDFRQGPPAGAPCARTGSGSAPAAPTVAPPIAKAPAPAQPTALVPDQFCRSYPAARARTRALSLRSAGRDTSGGQLDRRPRVCRRVSRTRRRRAPHKCARPCPRRSSPPTPRRVARRPVRATEMAPARGPGNVSAPSSVAPASPRRPGESRGGSRGPENGVYRSNGENGAARGAERIGRPAAQYGFVPSAV